MFSLQSFWRFPPRETIKKKYVFSSRLASSLDHLSRSSPLSPANFTPAPPVSPSLAHHNHLRLLYHVIALGGTSFSWSAALARPPRRSSCATSSSCDLPAAAAAAAQVSLCLVPLSGVVVPFPPAVTCRCCCCYTDLPASLEEINLQLLGTASGTANHKFSLTLSLSPSEACVFFSYHFYIIHNEF